MPHVAPILHRLKQEAAIVVGFATLLVLGVFGIDWAIEAKQAFLKALLFGWLFAVILICAFRVIHHANRLADRYGEPYGSMILTFSLLTVEVSLIASVMLTGGVEPTLARDTMFAGIMLTLNGVVGVALLLGGLQHGQQEFNLEGARAYLAALIPLAVIGLILPNFTGTGTGALTNSQAIAIGVATVIFYAIFLTVQTMRHRSFFVDPTRGDPADRPAEAAASVAAAPARPLLHFLILVVGLLLIVLLARELAPIIDQSIHRFGVPTAIGGILIAILTLTPESVTALKAALDDKLQHSVNVFLGGALATIGLTVPCVLIIGAVSGHSVILGLQGSDIVLLLLTLFMSSMTFGGVKTNVLQGAVHLLIFVLYVILIFNP